MSEEDGGVMLSLSRQPKKRGQCGAASANRRENHAPMHTCNTHDMRVVSTRCSPAEAGVFHQSTGQSDSYI